MRLRFVRGGMWDDSILVFTWREVYADYVRVEGDKVRVVGTDRESNAKVDEVIDPRDVCRVIH
jgi:hypothetical protein